MIPEFHLADLTFVFSWGLLALLLGSGVLVGRTSIWAPSGQDVLERLIKVGAPFFLTMALYRGFVDHSAQYEVWLGALFLFGVYICGCVLGLHMKRRGR